LHACITNYPSPEEDIMKDGKLVNSIKRIFEYTQPTDPKFTKDELEFIKKAVFSLTRRIKDKEELGYYQPEMSYQVLNEIDPNLTK